MRRPHPPGLPAAGTHTRLQQCAEGRLNGATQTLVSSGPPGGQRDASAEPCLQPGDVLLERFRVHRLLARGGMGEVYDVFDAALGAPVALKRMRTQVLAPASALEQFRREVLLARRVTHPNVCRLFEFFSSQDDAQDPLVFLTMELLEGATLSEHLAREGKLGDEALPLVRQMVAALSAAHREGVVHRDFKSSNVMLVRASDGAMRVVVTDFGLACGVRPGEAGDLLLDTGMVGSPLYMAPEQVTGDVVSPATDVYALGVVLYEMVTATLPFVGDTVMESAYERLKRAPEPPSVRRPGLNGRWNRAILRCLEVDPARRFSRVEDVLQALGEGPVVLPDQRRRLLRRAVVAAGLAVALAVGGSAGAHLLASPAAGPNAPPSVR
jgi:eukaryotic-like serine/threonine-protein kinase